MSYLHSTTAVKAIAAFSIPLSPLISSLFLSDDSSDFSKALSAVVEPKNFVTYCDARNPANSMERKQGQIKDAILHWKVKQDALKAQWEKDEDCFSALPSRAWPPQQPDADEQSDLETKFIACERDGKDTEACDDITFKLATCLVFNNIDSERGLQLYKLLASKGHIDGTVAAGVVLLEGLGVPYDEAAGINLLSKKNSITSPQGAYEYATAIYTGIIDVNDPNREAFKLFRYCAEQQHTGGLFMTAEMIYTDEASGDIKEAVQLYAAAAERGHRMARQRMREFFKY